MEEGTYGSPIYQPPGSGLPVSRTATPPASAFKANVARKKTRKWVEARKINYDGSGWGDEDDEDEYDDDDDSGNATPSDQAPPPLPSLGTPRLPSASLPSQQPQQTLHAAHGLPSMAASRSATPSSLHARGSPSPARQASPAGDAVPAPWTDHSRTASPLGPRAQSPAAAARRNFIRPSDIYKRAVTSSPEDGAAPSAASAANAGTANSEKLDVVPRGRTMPTTTPAPIVTTAPSPPTPAFTAAPTASTPTYSVFPKTSPTRTIVTGPAAPSPDETPAPAPAPAPPRKDSPLPPLPPAQEALSVSAAPPAVHRPQDSVDSTASAASGASISTHESEELRRFSTSPKLPDLARFSTFSPDLLFGGAGFLSPTDAPPVPSLPTSPAVASFPKDEGGSAAPPNQMDAVASSTTETVPPPEEDRQTPKQQHQQQQQTGSISSVSDGVSALRDSSATAATGITAPFSDGARQSAGDGSLALPTVAYTKVDGESVEYRAAAASQDDQIPTTAPLNPRRSSHLFLSDAATVTAPAAIPATTVMLPHYDAAPLHSTDTGSPIKETDILSDEIIRTLSPVGMTAEPESLVPDEGVATGAPASPEALPRADAPQATGEPASGSAAAVVPAPATRGVERARTPTRESSYLQSVYDDYLPADGDDDNEAGGGSAEAHPPLPDGAPLAVAAAAAAGVTAAAATAAAATGHLSSASPTDGSPTGPSVGAETRDVVPAAVPEVSTSPATQEPVVAPAVAPATDGGPPGLRRQFSWEVAKETAPEPPQLAHPALKETAPAELRRPSVASLSDEEEVVKEKEEALAATKASPTEMETETGTETAVAAAVPAPAPLRSMLDVDDEPAPTARAPSPAAPSPGARSPAAQPSPTPQRVSMASSSLSPTQSLRTVRTGQSGVGAAGALSSPTQAQAQLQPHQFLTLKQCMAFSTHQERMAKLAEARREYAAADSGLTAWLTAMTTAAPEYRAPYASVWGGGGGGGGSGGGAGDAASLRGDGDEGGSLGGGGGGVLGLSPSLRRPVAAHVPHVPHVSMPSSTQISHKSKELLAATGKAGKGLLALRKKGFHKKTAN